MTRKLGHYSGLHRNMIHSTVTEYTRAEELHPVSGLPTGVITMLPHEVEIELDGPLEPRCTRARLKGPNAEDEALVDIVIVSSDLTHLSEAQLTRTVAVGTDLTDGNGRYHEASDCPFFPDEASRAAAWEDLRRDG